MDYTGEKLIEASICQKYLKKIKGGAVGSLIFGAIALIMGYSDFSDPEPIIRIFSLLLMLLGFFLAVEGVIALLKPSPGTLKLEGIAFILVGAWNILIGGLSLLAGAPQSFFLILGGWQIYLGINNFKEAKEFEGVIAGIPDKSILEAVENLTKELLNSRPKQADQYIEFAASTFTKPLQWKGKFSGDNLILYSMPDERLRFLKRNDIEVTNKGKVVIGKTLKIEARIKEAPEFREKRSDAGLVPDLSTGEDKRTASFVSYNGTMEPEYLERIENWKKQPGDSHPFGDEQEDEIYKAPL